MATWHKRLVPAIAATSLMLGTGTVATAVSAAEEAVLIPGATVFKQINPMYPILANTYPVIGINFHYDDDSQRSTTRKMLLPLTTPSWTAWSKRTSLFARPTAKLWSSANRWEAWLRRGSQWSWPTGLMPPRQTTSGSS